MVQYHHCQCQAKETWLPIMGTWPRIQGPHEKCWAIPSWKTEATLFSGIPHPRCTFLKALRGSKRGQTRPKVSPRKPRCHSCPYGKLIPVSLQWQWAQPDWTLVLELWILLGSSIYDLALGELPSHPALLALSKLCRVAWENEMRRYPQRRVTEVWAELGGKSQLVALNATETCGFI